MELGYDIRTCSIVITHHFRMKYMEEWGMRQQQVRIAIKEAYLVERVGKRKYEAYFMSGKRSKKIIFAYDKFFDEIIVISGAEGK